jgi:hypothetical protein
LWERHSCIGGASGRIETALFALDCAVGYGGAHDGGSSYGNTGDKGAPESRRARFGRRSVSPVGVQTRRWVDGGVRTAAAAAAVAVMAWGVREGGMARFG